MLPYATYAMLPYATYATITMFRNALSNDQILLQNKSIFTNSRLP